MYLTGDSTQQILQEKRNKFHVEIRRKRTENTFQQKRAIFVQNKDLELLAQYALEFYNRGDIQECENYLIRLNQYADSQYSANLKSINTITFLGEIATTCDAHILAIIVNIYQKIYLPECLNPYLLSQVQRFENNELVKQFVVLLHKIAKNNPINHLIEQCDFVSYLVEISLLLEHFEDWFHIVQLIGTYTNQPSKYFKKLVMTCIKFIEQDTELATFQIILSMISCEKDNKSCINYLLTNSTFVDLVMDKLEKKDLIAISIISKVVEESDEGTIQFLQAGMLKILSGLFFNMRENQTAFTYIIANICFLKNDYVISEVVTSEIFYTILALDEQELDKNEFIYISQMLKQLIRKYSNEKLYYYLLTKTDFVYMLGHLMKQYELREVIQNTISCILHMANSQSDELTKKFRQKIIGKPIEYVLMNIQYLFQDINIIEKVYDFLNIKQD